MIRSAGIAGYRRRRRVKTTKPDPAAQKVPDLLGRVSPRPEPNTKYVGDISYLPLAIGANLYLATVIDCCSRRVAGWAIAEHMRTELVERCAQSRRRSVGRSGQCRIPTDHGSHTPQRISRNSAWSWRSARALVTRSPNRSPRPSNASVLQDDRCWSNAATAAARSSGGWSARPPTDNIRTAAISAPPTTKPSTHPLRCPKSPNPKPRVRSPGSRPGSPGGTDRVSHTPTKNYTTSLYPTSRT